MDTKKRTVATTALALSAFLAVTACGGASDDDKPSAQAPSTAESTAPSVDGFPVGEPFEDAEWSVEVDGATRVSVRPDRVIADTTTADTNPVRTIRAYTAEGKEAWKHEVTGMTGEDIEQIPVWVLDETVAVLEKVNSEGSGLDEDQVTDKLTLLSQQDGSVVAEEGAATVDEHGVIVLGDGDKALTEDGKVIDHEPAGTTSNSDSVAGTPLDPSLKAKDFIEADVLAVDHKQGMTVLDVTAGPTPQHTYHGVDTKTGKVAYELECPGYSHTDGENKIAINSPNGKYGVHESIWISATEGKCFGGGDGQKQIEFTAVDDKGTAYGVTKGSALDDKELVVITDGGEPELSDAPAPVGIVNGDVAIHIDGAATNGNSNETIYEDATTITGNPIK